MLTKILFTLLVIIGVSFYFRTKPGNKAQPKTTQQTEHDGQVSIPTRTVAYILIGFLILVSLGVFFFKWQSDNTILHIRVISDSGVATEYQARQKLVKGRSFETLDGIQVNLGESERMEVLNH